MSFSVVCPSCKEKNPGHVFNCVKCNTNLIGIPRIEDFPSENATTGQQNKNHAFEEPKIESLGHALWRSLRGSIIIFALASLFTGIICFLGNWRKLSDFGSGLIYAGVFLVFIGWYILKGSEGFVRSQINPYNPMNRAMPGTHSERTRQYWRDYMEGMNSVAVIGFSVVLCFGLGWLLISLAN